jgi:hypothetical protein
MPRFSIEASRKRWLVGGSELEKFAAKPKPLREAVSRLLADKPRPGSPCVFTAEQICRLLAVACETPPGTSQSLNPAGTGPDGDRAGYCGAPISQQCRAFFNIGGIKPHRIKYWLNHGAEDEAVFRQEVRNVCILYHQAQALHDAGVHVVSVDEKRISKRWNGFIPIVPWPRENWNCMNLSTPGREHKR